MGSSRAWGVYRGSDAAEVHAWAKRLCELLEERDPEVGLVAELRTVAEVRRMAELLPGAEFDQWVPGAGGWAYVEREFLDVLSDEELAAELPMSVMADVPAHGTVVETFVAALGAGQQAWVEWHGRWPDEPEHGSSGFAQYDGVQVVFHGDEARPGDRTAHHTVFVHLGKWAEPGRAARLAAAVGGEVVGGEQIGW